MLHELLVALSGYSDAFLSDETLIDIFNKEEKDDKNEKFEEVVNITTKRLLGNSPYFHVSEKSIIKDLLKIAILNKRLLLFNNYYGTFKLYNDLSENSSNSSFQKGHYMAAFASAIYDESKSYQVKIVELEERILEDPNLSLSILLLELQPFESILAEICNLITMIEQKKLYGCKVLELIHHSVISTVGDNHKVVQRIEKRSSKVFLEHLSHWLLYGELLDANDEFFIQIKELKVNQQPEMVKLPITSSEDQELYNQIKTMNLLDGRTKDSTKEAVLNSDLLPDFIDFSSAENILFIGESIQFFEKGHTNYDQTGLVLKKRENEFVTRFRKLINQDEFCIKELLELIETIRVCVSKSLYTLVTESGLVEELCDFKAIFLMGRGELYQSLFILTKDIKQTSPYVSSINFDALFKKAGHQVLLDDKLLNKFNLHYRTDSELDERGSIWKNLYVSYNMKRPFHQIFNSKQQQDYNAILKFLLAIRLAQFRLQQLWISTKGSGGNDKVQLICCTIRHQMSSLIYNLQYYIKVDVLESGFSSLLNEINSHEDYQQMERAHKLFLSSVANGCFLSHPLLSASIECIITKIHFFCDMCDADLSSEEAVNALREDFEMVTIKFYWALSVLSQHRSSRYISQLITRIDYNRFYSSKSSSNDMYSCFET